MKWFRMNLPLIQLAFRLHDGIIESKMTSKTHWFNNGVCVHVPKLICSMGVSNFQTFELLFCMYDQLFLHAAGLSPAKRSQHANATYRNIVGHNMLCAFGHTVAGCCWLKFENGQI